MKRETVVKRSALATFFFAAIAIAACGDDAPGGGPTTNGGPTNGGPTNGGPTNGTDGGTTDGGAVAPAPTGPMKDGIATYYDATGAGNCMFDPSPEDLMVAAMNAEEYAGSAACGTCAEVEGPDGDVLVRIVDQCPECERGHLDLSEEAFAKIAAVERGRVPIRWRTVRCPVTGPVRYKLKDGSNPYWTAIQVRNHAVAVAKLEIQKGRTGAFVDAPRESYNYFVLASGAGPGPYRVRITSATGATLEDDLPAVVENAEVPGAAQFP